MMMRTTATVAVMCFLLAAIPTATATDYQRERKVPLNTSGGRSPTRDSIREEVENRPELPEIELPLEDNVSTEGTVAPHLTGRTDVVDGRQDLPPTDCNSPDGNMHHLPPCEDDVDSPEMTRSPTEGRTDIPAESPTEAPTGILSLTTVPTIANSDIPSDNPSLSPSREPCEMNDGGAFGEIDTEPEIVVAVQYLYEMEVVAGTTDSEIENDILPALEIAIGNSLLSEVFPGECGSQTSESRHRRRLSVRRRLAVLGMSMNPPDAINPDVSCEQDSLTDAENSCVIVDGELMLFTDNGNAQLEQEVILEIIQSNMASGDYLSSSPQLVRLRMIDEASPNPPGSIDPPGGGTDGNGDGSGDGGTQNSLRVGLFVGLFSGVIILSGVLYRLNRNVRNGDAEDVTTYQADNSQNVSALTQSMQDDPRMM